MTQEAKRDRRRQQLIEATIDTIAERGLVGTTLAQVAKAAGVSYGVVGFYFRSKDALLRATLDQLAADYEAVASRAAEKAGPSPAAKLVAIVEADFSAEVAQRRKIAAWTAFWSESRATPAFKQRCIELQDAYLALTGALCRSIVEAGGYAVDPQVAAAGLNAMVYGQWIELQLRGSKLGREQAKKPCLLYLKALFPDELAALVRDAA
ncbi:transcriptional regulator, TetR family [Tistlia consotensis]|uniref:Transcriptional regulator, TetR family n=1 Tax=Tistlia consotensis USBA 355 TaxID=560819 RepID=A0A1Y6BPG0_9PROT|nr:transcriptional regulator BetI [Tistlia consotensis]SMF13924.1 transcriptional regulator, TetR family [Tistlia consotensis USBA 355]SNR50058.1 transcriptional regulator, TetR family [Tistlia consotensis]